MSGLYTRYIKIAKIDKNGNNNTNALSSLTTITIPWSDGSKARYKIVGISQQQDYFAYTVEYQSTSSIYQPDASTLDYNFSGSFSTSSVFVGKSSVINVNLPVEKVYPTSSYLFSINKPHFVTPSINQATIYFDTYPQKDIQIQFSGSAAAGATSDVNLLGTLRDSNGVAISPSTNSSTGTNQLLENIPAGTTESFNVIWNIPSSSFDPGICLGITTFATNNTSLTLQPDVFLNISSSIGTRTPIQAVLEPFLDYKFRDSNCDVLQGNVIESRPNPYIQDIDYTDSQILPSNYQALKNYNAVKGTYPESNFTMTSILNPSYGSKNQTINFNVYQPLGFGGQTTTAFGDPINIGTFGQTPSATISSNFVVYFKTVSSFNFGGGKLAQRFEPSYLVTPDERLLEITSEDLIMEQLKQVFNPIPFPSSRFGDSTGPLTFKSVSFSSTGSYVGNYTGIGDIATGSLGEIFLNVFSDTSGGFEVLPSGLSFVRNAGGIVFPASIEFSETPDLPSKAKELLSKNNLI